MVVLGAVPPPLDLLASPACPVHARMTLYHLSLAAVNQTARRWLPGGQVRASLAPGWEGGT